jgi:hypothetical protein
MDAPDDRSRRWGTRAVVSVAVALAGLLGGCSGTPSRAAPESGLTPGTTADAGGTTRGGASPTHPSATPTGRSSTAAPGPVGEVLSTVAAPAPSLGALASRARTAAPTPQGVHLSGPLPRTASTRGALVAGFPRRIVPLPPGGAVVSSSVSAQGRRLQVGLEASTPQPPTTVQRTYTRGLAGQGFTAAPTDPRSPAGPWELRFTRGDEAVTVNLRPRVGGGTEVVLIGTLTVAPPAPDVEGGGSGG